MHGKRKVKHDEKGRMEKTFTASSYEIYAIPMWNECDTPDAREYQMWKIDSMSEWVGSMSESLTGLSKTH